MTQQEWASATEEERLAEIEKCRTDLLYCYNTYWKVAGAPEITKEEWDSISGATKRRINPITFNNSLYDDIYNANTKLGFKRTYTFHNEQKAKKYYNKMKQAFYQLPEWLKPNRNK